MDGDTCDIMPKLTKLKKVIFIPFVIFTILQVTLPSPKIVAAMYGVDYLNKLNTSAEVSTSQIYKDLTTIIHKYAIEEDK